MYCADGATRGYIKWQHLLVQKSKYWKFLQRLILDTFEFLLTLHILQQINVKNIHPVNERCWDSNPRPSEHESPPITTRPGLLCKGESMEIEIGRTLGRKVTVLDAVASLNLTARNVQFEFAASDVSDAFPRNRDPVSKFVRTHVRASWTTLPCPLAHLCPTVHPMARGHISAVNRLVAISRNFERDFFFGKCN